MFPLPLLISPRLKTPISSERVGSDFEWVPSSPRSPFNCNLREPLPSASSAAASACPFYFGSGGCVDAVSAAIETLENDPCTNAGRGSNLTEDVHVECDASVMDGKSGTFGAVGAVPEKLCNGDKWTSQAGAKWTKIHPQQQQPNKRESDNSSSTAAAQGQNGQKQPPRMSSKNRKEPNNSSNTAGPPSTQDRGRKAKNYLQKLPPFLKGYEKLPMNNIMRIPTPINKMTRLTVLSKRNCWSLGFPKRNHSPNKTVAGASRGYPTTSI
ncbi:hypothetical protein LXL04_023500 [Taraxacum kok-saghyz]